MFLQMQGRVEELFQVNLSNYAIAVADDCSKMLSNYVSSDVLDAIQRSASKPWVSKSSYATNACMQDLGLVVIDASKLEKDFVEAILWWIRVLNISKRYHFTQSYNLCVFFLLFPRVNLVLRIQYSCRLNPSISFG